MHSHQLIMYLYFEFIEVFNFKLKCHNYLLVYATKINKSQIRIDK